MILIIGGAYQGKLEYAMRQYGLEKEDVYTCTGAEVDFSARCIHGLEAFTEACVRQGTDAVVFFEEQKDAWKESILICRDISGGVVPIEAELRAWRQMNGRLCQYLAANAENVSRIYCGLEQKLK